MKLFLFSAVAAIIASLWYFRINITQIFIEPKGCDETRKFTYWPVILDKWNENDNLRSMKRVFERLGYRMVNGTEEHW